MAQSSSKRTMIEYPQFDSDDSISLTSTKSSEAQDQYGIDGGILAERQVDDEMQYLVKWEDYDEHRNTWEPEDNFRNEETLRQWREKKMRVTRGLDKPFDVIAWEVRVQRIMDSIAIRKQRRRRKRKSLGIEVESSSASSDADSSDSNAPLISSRSKIRMQQAIASTATSPEFTGPESATSRRPSTSLSQAKPWTDQERRALEAGVASVKGFLWDKVLDLYGAQGTVNHDLKFKSKLDMQKMAFTMKREFLNAGQEPPDWLKNVKSGRLQQTESTKSHSATSRPPLESSSDEGIVRPIIEGEVPKENAHPSSSIKASPNRGTYKGTARLPTARDIAGLKASKKPSKLLIPDSPKLAREKSTNLVNSPGSVMSTSYKATARSKPSTPVSQSRRRSSTTMVAQGSPMETPRQMGARGAGPARMSDLKAKTSSRSQKAKISSKDPAKAKEVLQAPNKTVFRPYKNLSAQNRSFKKQRNEPAPDLASLTFIDPKTGKPSEAPPPLLPATQSPDDQHAESIADQISNVDAGLQAMSPVTPSTPAAAFTGSKSRLLHVMDTDSSFPRGTGNKSPPINQCNASNDITMDEITVMGQAVSKIPPKGKAKEEESEPPKGPAALRKAQTQYHQYTLAGFDFIREPIRQAKIDLYNFQIARSTYVAGQFNVGSQSQKPYPVRLQGIDWALQKLLLTIKVMPSTVQFDLKRTCLAAEYERLLLGAPSDFIGQGFVVAPPQSIEQVDLLAQRLAFTLSGALCVAPLFTLIFYPVGSDAWSFFDRNFEDVPEGAALRFVVRKPLPLEFGNKEISGLSTWIEEDYNSYLGMVASLSSNLTEGPTNSINTVFKELYGIEYARLVAHRDPKFFICFIPAGCEQYEKDPAVRQALRKKTSEEHDLFLDFLRANGAEVYSLQKQGSEEPAMNGSWDYFAREVKSGVIVIHDACTRFDQIPRLARMLRQPVSVWRFSLEPMDNPDARSSYLTRLFPHGGVILLTESLMLYHSKEALRILMWLRLVVLQERTPGSWKLAVRFHVRPWLLDILDLYEDTQIDVFGCGKQVFGEIYANITWLLEADSPPYGMMCYDWDDETPDDEAPLVAPASLRTRKEWKFDGDKVEVDHESITSNDDLLVRWFAEWAMVACEDFRKFHVALGYKDDEVGNEVSRKYQETWGHIEAFTLEKCLQTHKIISLADLEVKDETIPHTNRKQAPRSKVIQEILPEDRERIDQGREKVMAWIGGDEEQKSVDSRSIDPSWTSEPGEVARSGTIVEDAVARSIRLAKEFPAS